MGVDVVGQGALCLETKLCSGCKEWRPLEDFARDSRSGDGRGRHCRACKATMHRRQVERGVRGPVLVSKRCSRCGEVKPAEEFYPASRGVGLTSKCRVCTIEAAEAWRKAHPERIQAGRRYARSDRGRRVAANSRLRSSFGITLEQYESKLAEQDGRCAICRREPLAEKRLGVDHDHRCCPGEKTCGRCLRDLLCNDCNSALGLFGDDPERLEAAAAYLRRFLAVLG